MVDTNNGKSFLYQSIPLIIGSIVLVISLIIALIKNQVDWLFSPILYASFTKLVEKHDSLLGIDISAITLIALIIKSDPKV